MDNQSVLVSSLKREIDLLKLQQKSDRKYIKKLEYFQGIE